MMVFFLNILHNAKVCQPFLNAEIKNTLLFCKWHETTNKNIFNTNRFMAKNFNKIIKEFLNKT